MPRYRLNLEVGSDGSCMAHVAELPGCIAIGGTKGEAVARAREAVAAYVGWLGSYGERMEAGQVEVEVADEVAVAGCFPGTPGDQVARFESDRGPVTDAEIERALRWLGWSRAELAAMFAGIAYEELDWGLPGQSWTLRTILQHVASAEAWYLRHLEEGATHHLPSTLGAVRSWAQLRLRGMTAEERSALRVHDGEEWTARKALRRFLEHEREHTGQLREMLGRYAEEQEARKREQETGCGCFVLPWTEVARYDHWRVFLNRNQDYLGKCIIALARHEEDFLALTARERDEMWEVTARVREGLRKLSSPDHFNYQVLGNEVRHVHMHLTPRYREAREFARERFKDEHWGTWPYPSERKQPRRWVEGLIEALKRELGPGR